MNNRGFFIGLGIGIVVLILIGFGLYYLVFYSGSNENKYDDLNCASLEEDLQEECCAEQNKDGNLIACVGNWQIVEDQCKFVCEEEDEIRFCTQDVKDCGSGLFVSRDPKNDCAFSECPNQ